MYPEAPGPFQDAECKINLIPGGAVRFEPVFVLRLKTPQCNGNFVLPISRNP